MARPRRVTTMSQQSKTDKSSSGGSSTSSPVRTARTSGLLSWRGALGAVCLSVAVYYTALGYRETRVNTPFDDKKIARDGLAVPERFWGTYRSGHYFGLRTRSPRSPLLGLMWYDQGRLARNQAGVRHWCSQDDNLSSYGWLRHDGVSFGEQIIVDDPYVLRTSFVKTDGLKGGGWTARIEVDTQKPTKGLISLVWYVALDESLGVDQSERVWLHGDNAIGGHNGILGRYRVTPNVVNGTNLRWSSAEGRGAGVHLLKEKLMDMLRIVQRDDKREIVISSDQIKEEGANFVAIQITGSPPFTIDYVYSSDGSDSVKGDGYTAALEEKRRRFDAGFEAVFRLEEKGYNEKDIQAARAALSNLVGGISYMYGAGRVQSVYTKDPVPYWRAPLYTAVPSRSFFPRGFLWDEGFHGLLIGRWSPEIQLDIASHWFDLINVEGWIPREQILGVEAAARVPKEFVVQNNAAANPPMLLIQLGHLVSTRPTLFTNEKHRQTLHELFPRLQAWYQWFLTTQKGEETGSFRWRGRDNDARELNPKTLTSGLDDYPRASHPSDIERHVDLRCWMYAAADALVTIGSILDRDTSKYEAIRDQLGDEDQLNALHWSEEAGMYADYGMHTDDAKLARAPRQDAAAAPPPVLRVVDTPPTPQLVTSAFGYVSLFPMLLKVLPPSSPKLAKILEDLDKPELLWSNYGLRSLSRSSPYYMKRNTEHDPPYWRGQVWVNINYLALSALKHYSEEGPVAVRAKELHDRLRDNIVGTVLSEYSRSGYLWEQYSDSTGAGSGCRPFTGWTALVVNIMSKLY